MQDNLMIITYTQAVWDMVKMRGGGRKKKLT